MELFLNTPEAVAAAVRDGRTALGLAQAELTRRAGVGRRFVVDLEAGHPRAELGKVLAVLSALGIHATALPAPPVEPTSMHDVDLQAVIARHA